MKRLVFFTLCFFLVFEISANDETTDIYKLLENFEKSVKEVNEGDSSWYLEQITKCGKSILPILKKND